MKQVLQSLRTGKTEVAEVPRPSTRRGELLIQTTRTLVSSGTERMLVEFGKANWIAKARQQPDKVHMVINKVRTDGLMPTIESVFNKLDQPIPLGYCNVGRVIRAGVDAGAFAVGDRVVSNGQHAEFVSVPKNLCTKVPDNVSDDEAAFTVIGAIGLQGIRLVQPTLGEVVVVTGLGLIGLITVQLLRAHGCRVLGIDFDREKIEMARRYGAEVVDLSAGTDPVAAAHEFSRGRGVDAVIITAATASNEPVHQAALMSRKRGRIVLVGVVGLELSRADFYEKELTFQVSCSYGPGRYDPSYEQGGVDYPVGFVRWTEQRNFEAVLDMMADGNLEVRSLVSHRIAIAEAERAYAVISGDEPSLGILLEYPISTEERAATTVVVSEARSGGNRTPVTGGNPPSISFIGAGNYASAVLIPAFKRTGARLKTVASRGGVSGLHAARKFGFEQTTTDIDTMFDSNERDALVITTRHDSHASLVVRALNQGRPVFVEKPLALTLSQVAEIEEAWCTAHRRGESPLVMIGFNRRFAPHVLKMKRLLSGIAEPKAFVMTVNAGAIPLSHWTQDPMIGGGRMIGEGCHFVDLLRALAGVPITNVTATPLRGRGGDPLDDRAFVTLQFADGSAGSIQYLANGSKAFPKERLEVFAAGRVLQLDNFRVLNAFGWPGFTKQRLWRQDKGQNACAAAFVDALRASSGETRTGPIPFDEILEVSRATIQAAEQLRA